MAHGAAWRHIACDGRRRAADGLTPAVGAIARVVDVPQRQHDRGRDDRPGQRAAADLVDAGHAPAAGRAEAALMVERRRAGHRGIGPRAYSAAGSASAVRVAEAKRRFSRRRARLPVRSRR